MRDILTYYVCAGQLKYYRNCPSTPTDFIVYVHIQILDNFS